MYFRKMIRIFKPNLRLFLVSEEPKIYLSSCIAGADSQNFLRSFFVLKKFLRKFLKIWYSQNF